MLMSCLVEKLDGEGVVLLDLQVVPREGEHIVLGDGRMFKVAGVKYSIGDKGISHVTLTCWIVDP